MPVQARFLDNGPNCVKDSIGVFQIRKDGNKYSLPLIRLGPAEDNLPHISMLVIRGQDGPQLLLDALNRLTSRRVQPPRKLTEEMPVAMSLTATPPLESGQCTLVFEVLYYDSDETGQPVSSRLQRKQFTAPLAFATAESPIDLIVNPIAPEPEKVEPIMPLSEPPSIPPAQLPPPGVDPLSLVLTVNDAPAVLRIEAPIGSPLPRLRLIEPTMLPDEALRQHLNRMLETAAPVRIGKSGTERESWEIKLALQLPDPLKRQLYPDIDSPPIPVKVRTQAGDASCDHELQIECRDNQFPGWITVDFGTSNSTVTMFDPKKVDPVQGLPGEQSDRLRKSMIEWLEQKDPTSLPGRNAAGELLFNEWQQLLSEIGNSLTGKGLPAVVAPFQSGDKAAIYSLLRQIEQWLVGASAELQRAVHLRLHAIFHEALRVPALKDLHLVPVELEEARGETEILSEAEVVALEPLKLLMGEQAKQDRLRMVFQGEDTAGQFHHSLKRYLGTERQLDIRVGDEVRPRQSPDGLIQAALGHLLELTDACRQRHPKDFSAGRIRRAIVTYPVVSPPTVRQNLEKLVIGLGIPNVKTDYDEAVSIAIFFLMREFGGNLGTGLEAFKARCHRSDSRWSQNVMVLAIGGGTTAIALIRLTLEDKTPPFEADEDAGAGGRYYVITPKLLGSSGHLQLGGDLVTLRTFQLLKAAIADRLLTLAGARQDGPLAARITSLVKPFVDADHHYVPESLHQHVRSEKDLNYQAALDAAEEVIPTRWKSQSKRLQTFETLWDFAEKAKIHLGRQRHPGALEEPFILEPADIQVLLQQCDLRLDGIDEQDLRVTLDRDSFEHVAGPVIEEAVKIAKGLLESGLRVVEKDGRSQKQPLDWLILSGKTCNLALVDREIRRIFSTVDYFVWNPERVTFDPRFAKLATSIGACYAEHLWQLGSDPEGAKDLLKKGFNQFYFDIKNLFFFLSCSFTRMIPEGRTVTVFTAGTRLYQLDEKPVGKARADWQKAPSQITVMRKDYDDSGERHWATFDGDTLLTKKLGLARQELRENFYYQLEINHKLWPCIYLCRGKPHYLVSANIEPLPLEQSLRQLHDTVPNEAGAAGWSLNPEGRLEWDIAVGVLLPGEPSVAGVETMVFKAGDPFDKVFHTTPQGDRKEDQKGDQTVRGMISQPLPESLFKHNNLDFYARRPDQTQWERLGSLHKPGSPSEFPRFCRVTLDAEGQLRLHASEVPYWTSEVSEVLKSTEGCVYSEELVPGIRDIDEERDPFCGIH